MIVTKEKIERLRAIFDPENKLETDDDLIELAQYVEDEANETDTWIDHNFDFGAVEQRPAALQTNEIKPDGRAGSKQGEF